jgi:hypothetical protein
MCQCWTARNENVGCWRSQYCEDLYLSFKPPLMATKISMMDETMLRRDRRSQPTSSVANMFPSSVAFTIGDGANDT